MDHIGIEEAHAVTRGSRSYFACAQMERTRITRTGTCAQDRDES